MRNFPPNGGMEWNAEEGVTGLNDEIICDWLKFHLKGPDSVFLLIPPFALFSEMKRAFLDSTVKKAIYVKIAILD